MQILRKLEKFRELPGYLGGGVFAPDGQMIAGVTEVSGMSFEIAGSIFHDAFVILDNNAKETGFGHMDLVQVNTKKAIVFGQCYWEGDIHFHMIVVVAPNANVAKTKLMIAKVIEDIKGDIPKN